SPLVKIIFCSPGVASFGTLNIKAPSVFKVGLNGVGILSVSNITERISPKPEPVTVTTVLEAPDSGLTISTFGFEEDSVNGLTSFLQELNANITMKSDAANKI